MAEPPPPPPPAPSLAPLSPGSGYSHLAVGGLLAGADSSNNSSILTPNLGSGPLEDDAALSDLDLLQLFSMAGDSIDPEQVAYRKALTYYLMGIMGSVVCCLGTIANALSVAVLTRRTMRSSTYMYLAALAVCDSLVLFFTLLLILKDTRPPDSPNQMDQFHAVLFPFVHPTAVVFQVTSIWLTLAFTVDRYIMICHPFKSERMCRRSRARKVIICLYVAGLLLNIPRYFEYYTKTDTFQLTNSSTVYTVYGIETTSIGTNEIFLEVMHSWFYLICVCGIPFLTLVILNAFLIRAVHLSRLKGKEINAREKHRNDTTIMLIGVIVIFLICQGPALVSRMVYAFKSAYSKNKIVFTLNEVGSFLVILNSAVNIVPYYLFGKKFRSEFWRLFCTCFFDQDELRRIVRSYSVSMDNRRNSQHNGMEMNGLGGGGGADRDAGYATRYLAVAGQDYGLQRKEIQPLHGEHHPNQLAKMSSQDCESARRQLVDHSQTDTDNVYSEEGHVTTCFGTGCGSDSRAKGKQHRRFSDWTKKGGGQNSGCMIRTSQTSDSVAVPLIHSTYTSLSSGGFTTSNSNRDLSSNFGDLFSNPKEREPLNPAFPCSQSSALWSLAPPVPGRRCSEPGGADEVSSSEAGGANGHVHYMSVTSGPCIREPECSPV
ncbi:FMRFamide receptor [Plakobranchus ocellatus]|uniref:FMRFamide receptor n=1 Tax=Plakobranchus ocellatus TaxID=259542 RepID=A0AAV3Y5D9_9GAST|nr:FMRFamide receptor [Plakobranchus ocellatus]